MATYNTASPQVIVPSRVPASVVTTPGTAHPRPDEGQLWPRGDYDGKEPNG